MAAPDRKPGAPGAAGHTYLAAPRRGAKKLKGRAVGVEKVCLRLPSSVEGNAK